MANATADGSAVAYANRENLTREKAIDAALEAAQVPEMGRLIEKMLRDQARTDQRSKNMTKDQKRDLGKILQLFFKADAFEQGMRAGVSEKGKALPLDDLLAFVRAVDTPFVRRMQRYELASLDFHQQAAIETHSQVLKKKLPAENRLRLVGRYVVATGTLEQSVRFDEKMARRMLMAGDAGLDAAALDARMDELRPRIVEAAADKSVIFTLSVFRKVDDPTLEKYIEILEQPPVSRVSKLLGDVVGEQIDLMVGRMFQVMAQMSSGVSITEVEKRLSTAPAPSILPLEESFAAGTVGSSPFGFTVADLSPEQKRQFGVKEGVLVTSSGEQGKPSGEEVSAFYNQHPELFSDRRIYNIQELSLAAGEGLIGRLLEKTAAVGTLDEAAKWLTGQGVQFTLSEVNRPADQLPLEILTRIYGTEIGRITVIRGKGSASLVRVLRTTRVEPVALGDAVPVIERFIMNERSMLRPGDVVIAAMRGNKDYPVASARDFHRLCSAVERTELITLFVLRDGQTIKMILLVPGIVPRPGLAA